MSQIDLPPMMIIQIWVLMSMMMGNMKTMTIAEHQSHTVQLITGWGVAQHMTMEGNQSNRVQ